MRNRLLSITRSVIPYVKELKPYAKTTNGVLLMQQLEYWFDKYPEGFYKFQKAQKDDPEAGKKAHPMYQKGDSWCEELEFSVDEFTSAWSKIGVNHASRTAYNNAANKFARPDGTEAYYCSVYDRLTHQIYYYRNDLAVDCLLDELSHSAQKGKAHFPKPESTVSVSGESQVRYADTTTETTSEKDSIAHETEPVDYFNLDSEQQDTESESKTNTPSISNVSDFEKVDLAPAACGKVEKRQLPRGGHDPQGFEAFWQQYPRKTAKANAQSAWNRLKANTELQATILHDLAQRKQVDHQWRDVAFVPHPATYLNGQRWQDEIIKPSSPPPVPRHAQTISEDEQMEYLRSYL